MLSRVMTGAASSIPVLDLTRQVVGVDNRGMDAARHDDPTTPLSAGEVALWRGFLRWSETVTAGVAQSLAVGAGLSQPDYEVLKRLAETGDGALSRQSLEQSLGWSPSRLSHQLRRMEARGLVARADAGRGRHVNVELAEEGWELLAAADGAHAAAVRRHLLDPLPPEVRAFLLAEQEG